MYGASVIDALREICDLEICLLNHPSHSRLPADWNVKLFASSPIGGVFERQLMSFSRGIKTAVWRYYSPALSGYLQSLQDGSFDAAVFLEENACIFEKFIPRGIPRILTRHNLDSRSKGIDAGSPVRLIRSVMTRYLSRRFDRWTNRRFSAIAIGSPLEKRILEKIGKNPVVSWLPTISIHDIPDRPVRAPEIDPSGGFKAVFIGDFRYAPNVEAINWLLGCEKYFNEKTKAALDIVLVGRSPPDLTAPAGLHISKMGFVADLMPLLDSCEIGVIPIVSGSGVKIKALTLLGSGMPVVTTPKGVEGLGVEDGVHCLIARTQKEFAAGIERLHDDSRLRATLRSEARSFILKNFSKQNQMEALQNLIEVAAGKSVLSRA